MVAATETSWLESLAVGDKVIAHDRFNRKRIVRVARVTKTQIVILSQNAEQRYRRSDGYYVGGWKYHYGFLARYTEADAEAIQLQTAQETVAACWRGMYFSTLTLEQCADVMACFRRVGLINDAKK